MAISADGRRLLVSASTANVVDVIHTRTGTIVDTFPSGDSPHENNFSKDGKLIYHASIGTVYTDTDDPSMDATKGERLFEVVDARTMKVIKAIDMGEKLAEAGYPGMSAAVRPMAITPNERYVYFQVSFFLGFVEYDLRKDEVRRRPRPAARGGEGACRATDFLLDSAHHGLAMNPAGRSSASPGRCRTTRRSSPASPSSCSARSRSARCRTGRRRARTAGTASSRSPATTGSR